MNILVSGYFDNFDRSHDSQNRRMKNCRKKIMYSVVTKTEAKEKRY